MTPPLFWHRHGGQFAGRPRSTYTACDSAGRLYTIGLDLGGTNAFAAVYDPVTATTLHTRTCLDYRVHADTLKRHLQHVADTLSVVPFVPLPTPHPEETLL